MTISLRAAMTGDKEFLFSVYASTRAAEMNLVDWDTSQKDSFLRAQFKLQDQYYKANYSDALYQAILMDGQPIGRLYIDRKAEEIRIMDIALLPEYRGQGIGSHLLKQILEEATTKNLPVTIHVERFNPALHLYERLGFCLAEDKGVYLFMKWSPPVLEQHENAR